jgi:hypothetical protein
MEIKAGQIWFDSTGHRSNYKVIILKVDDSFVTFRGTKPPRLTNTWMIEDFLKDAVYSESESIKSILKRYDTRRTNKRSLS